MKIGYIQQYDLELNPHLIERFKVYSKMLLYPVDYEDIVSTAEMMKKNPNLIIVREPFLLDDELRQKVTKWVEWANKADPKDYDPFA